MVAFGQELEGPSSVPARGVQAASALLCLFYGAVFKPLLGQLAVETVLGLSWSTGKGSKTDPEGLFKRASQV